MWNGSFLRGVTNGADWYAISGGMQDWSYRYMGCNEVTIELSNNKQPAAASISTYWNDNRQSMLNFIDTCLMGVRGVVTDAVTGLPLAATVRVSGRNHEVYTDPDVGDYHRMLLPGTYELSIEADGHDTLTNPAVPVGGGGATRWDVTLGSPTTIQYPNGGETLAVGVPAVLGWTGAATAAFHVQYSPDADMVATTVDDFEGGGLDPAYLTGGTQNWSLTTSNAHSPPTAVRSGTITHNEQSWISRSVEGGAFGFWYRVSTEANWDWFNFYIDGSQALHLAGNVNWSRYSTTLAPGSHEVKWEYVRDGSLGGGSDAVWIDDVEYTSGGATWIDVDPQTAPGATEATWTPPGVGAGYKIRARAEYADGSYGAWDESDAGFTVQAQPNEIPAVSDWGMAALVLLVMTAGTVVLRRARLPVPARNVSDCGRGEQDRGTKMNRAVSRRGAMLLALGCCLAGSTSFAAEPVAEPVAEMLAAARAGDVQRISDLLDARPALVGVKDRYGNTPLHLAVERMHVGAVERLVKAGAKLEAGNRDGLVPLHLVAISGSGPLDVRSKREALTRLLIAGGADVQARDGQGLSPLHWAARKGRSGMVALLLKAKAAIEAQDHKGRTPLHLAALGNHKGIIVQLVDRGAAVNATDKLGETPLHAAAHRFRPDATLALLTHGANVNATNKAGETALHVAAAQGPDEPEVERLMTDVARVL
ncbi:MAG: ankyrin repeat domain-containing protein, partial [Phycisphaerae bacterium]